MDSRDRLLITLGIIGIIAVALITSFGRSIFAHNIPSVVLPDITVTGDPTNPPTNWEGEQDAVAPVTVTVDTVQAVVDSLRRTDSYYRTLSIQLFWGEDGSATTPISVWRSGDWTATQQTTSTGLVRYDLVGSDNRYYWYDGDRHYLTTPATQNSADLSQRIPTYEDVVTLDSHHIRTATYAPYEGLPAIYVEVVDETGGRLERYWVSTESGLLIGAETEEDGQIIYRLTATDPILTPCPSDAPFILPDGTPVSELED